MEKKIYSKPCVEVVRLQPAFNLLGESDTDPGGGLANSSFWDSEQEEPDTDSNLWE